MGKIFFETLDFNVMMNKYKDGIKEILSENLLSIIITGSVALDGFIPGKGDIDFIIVTEHDLSSKNCDDIIEFHERLRAGYLGQLGIQLEGIYCPLAMLHEPVNCKGRGCYIGTSRKGWREISSTGLSMTDLFMIRKYGKVFYGEDIRSKIYNPTYDELKNTIISEVERNLNTSKEIKDIYFSLHLLYLGTRALYTFLNNKILSKGKSCDWFVSNFPNSKWISFVEYSSKYRYPLDEKEKDEINQEYIIKNAPSFLEDIYIMMSDIN